MGKSLLLVAVALVGLSACCREMDGLNLETSGSTGTSGAAASVENIARSDATAGAIDCGTFAVPYDFAGQWADWDAGPFEQGVSCVLGAVDAGEAFLMFVIRDGIDFQTDYAYLAGPDGADRVLWQSHEPNSPAETGPCVTDVDGFSCAPRFETGVLAPDVGVDAGGVRGLGCPDAGGTVVVSLGDPQCQL